MSCKISYIPDYLHQNDKPTVNFFHDFEKLYWRLGTHNEVAPYSSISLYDVSCNRSGVIGEVFSVEDDVLWNIEDSGGPEKYSSKVITLLVRKIFENTPTTILIRYPETGNEFSSVVMTLIHDPLSCNYAHCMFVFDLDGDGRVTKENYKDTFGKSKYKNVRKTCRDILNKAIIRGEIKFTTSPH